jgi:hypothetical protein
VTKGSTNGLTKGTGFTEFCLVKLANFLDDLNETKNLVIWLFGYLVIRLFGYSVIRLFGYSGHPKNQIFGSREEPNIGLFSSLGDPNNQIQFFRSSKEN